jgi:hypothetical protein
MNTDVDGRTRAALEALASTVTPVIPAVDDLIARRLIVAAKPRRLVKWRVGLAAAALIAVGVAAVTTLGRGERGDAPSPSGPASEQPSLRTTPPPTTVFAPQTTIAPDGTASSTPPARPAPQIVASIETARDRGRLVSAFGKVWQAGTTDQTVVGIDPATRQVVSTFEGMPGPYIAADGSSLYVCGEGGTIRLDPSTGETRARSTQQCFVALAVGAGSVWMGGPQGLVRLDATTLARQAVIPDVEAGWGIEYAFGSVWVADGFGSTPGGRGHVTRIDPSTNAVISAIATPSRARLFEVAGDSLWVAVDPNLTDVGLVRIDPATNIVTASLDTNNDATDVALAGRYLAVGSYFGTISLIDPGSATLLMTFDPAPTAARSDRSSIAWDGSVLWNRVPHIGDGEHGAVVAIDLGAG